MKRGISSALVFVYAVVLLLHVALLYAMIKVALAGVGTIMIRGLSPWAAIAVVAAFAVIVAVRLISHVGAQQRATREAARSEAEAS